MIKNWKSTRKDIWKTEIPRTQYLVIRKVDNTYIVILKNEWSDETQLSYEYDSHIKALKFATEYMRNH